MAVNSVIHLGIIFLNFSPPLCKLVKGSWGLIISLYGVYEDYQTFECLTESETKGKPEPLICESK